jgi:hypothetical protein
MPNIHEDECNAAGIDPEEVRRIAKGVEKYGRQARKLGIEFFGGSGICTMRFADEKSRNADRKHGKLIIATLLGFSCDGGDGGNQPYPPDGLNRGEP